MSPSGETGDCRSPSVLRVGRQQEEVVNGFCDLHDAARSWNGDEVEKRDDNQTFRFRQHPTFVSY